MEKLLSGAQELGLKLDSHQIEQFVTFYQELTSWNGRMNLTSITGYEEVQIKHFLDSLTVTLAWPEPPVFMSVKIIDIGTGAGIPGIPLKILLPDVSLVLLEATAKKVTFMHHLVDRLGLKKVEVIARRAEELAHDSKYRAGFDVVLARAVAPLPVLAELNLPFCAIGGSFIAQKKGGIEQEISDARKAITLLGGKLREVKTFKLKELPEHRCLVIVDKVASTPPEYPRRPGVPAKRPIKG